MDLRVLARLLVLFALLLAGCTGRKGNVCQEQDDCNDGLECCKTGGRALSDRGTCQVSCLPARDAGTPRDSGTDAFVDDGTCDLTADDDCPTGEFCNAASCFGPGVYEPIPASCEEIFEPVCSCEGVNGIPPTDAGVPDAAAPDAGTAPRTYQNACFARMARRRVAFVGTCEGGSVDAGPPMDAGTDAGTDAGADAGVDGG